MMKITMLFSMLCVIFNLGVSHAQMGYQTPSMEWLVVDSDLIVRATIETMEDVDGVALPSEPDQQPRLVRLLLRVTDTLKGEARDSIEVLIGHPSNYDPRDQKVVAAWIKSKVPLLWFLNEQATTKSVTVLRPIEVLRIHLPAIELGPTTGQTLPRPLLRVDLTLLRTEAELIDVAKAEVKRRGSSSKVKPKYRSLTYDVAARTGRAGDANALVVPDDIETDVSIKSK
jgi:hypothetical protein